jgi:hypothetical protein
MSFSYFRNKPKLRRAVEFSIKLVILLLLFATLYWQIAKRDDIAQVINKIALSFGQNFNLILLVFALMFVNWGIEALKWKLLINRAEPLSFAKSYLAVFSGATLTLFTPNRIGEYGGRFIFLKNPLRSETIQATILGSIAQILVTILAGLTGFFWWLSGSQEYSILSQVLFYSILVAAIAILTFLYFRLDLIAALLGRVTWLAKYQSKWLTLIDFSIKELLTVLVLAAVRYGVYAVQFLLLLYAFDVDVIIWHGLALIATFFLFQSSVPTIAIIDLGVRGNLALLVFAGYTSQLEQVVVSSFSLWLINLVLPALIGYVVILSTKLFRN